MSDFLLAGALAAWTALLTWGGYRHGRATGYEAGYADAWRAAKRARREG